MRVWSSVLFRELLRLGQPAGGGGPVVRRPLAPFAAAAWGAGSLPSLGLGLPPPPVRSVCTRSEGALQEPGKGPPLSARAPPADGGNNNNHHNGGQELAGAGGDKVQEYTEIVMAVQSFILQHVPKAAFSRLLYLTLSSLNVQDTTF